MTCRSIEIRFAHVYVESAFPPDLYPVILDALPETSLYTPDNPRKYGKAGARPRRQSPHLESRRGPAARELEPLHAAAQRKRPGATAGFDSRRLDRGRGRTPIARRQGTALLDDSPTICCARFRTDRDGVGRIEAHPRPSLIRDLSGYWIAPHPDTRAKIVTVQFYLARDRAQRELGTALYRRRLFNPRNLLSLKNMFQKVRQMEFLPNSGYAFPVGRRSWHGREEIPEASGERNSILLFYYRDASREW